MSIFYTVELAPITKKNSQRIVLNRKSGRAFIMPSEQYKKYEKAAGEYLKRKPKTPIADKVEIEYHFFMPTRRRVDLTNLIEAADDILVKYGIVEDDGCHIIASHDGSRVLYDHDHPRTEIIITEYHAPAKPKWHRLIYGDGDVLNDEVSVMPCAHTQVLLVIDGEYYTGYYDAIENCFLTTDAYAEKPNEAERYTVRPSAWRYIEKA